MRAFKTKPFTRFAIVRESKMPLCAMPSGAPGGV